MEGDATRLNAAQNQVRRVLFPDENSLNVQIINQENESAILPLNAEAELEKSQKVFIQKYNYDIKNDRPVEGEFQYIEPVKEPVVENAQGQVEEAPKNVGSGPEDV